jgi:hypothetical protein
MKKKFTLVLSALLMAGLVYDYNYRSVHSSSGSAPAGRTGSPGDGISCNTGCHGGQPGTPSGSEAVSITGLPAGGYVAGQTYDLTLTMTDPSAARWGFQLIVEDASNNSAGTLISGSGSTIVSSEYLTHSPAVSGSGSASWDFQWTAPASGSGDVGFYYAALFANNDFGNSGDVTINGSEMLSEASGVGISEAELAALSVYPNPVIDEINIAAKDVDEEIMITLFNVEGKKVIEQSFEPGDITIDVASKSLNSGIYFLQMEADRNTTVKKLLVK